MRPARALQAFDRGRKLAPGNCPAALKQFDRALALFEAYWEAHNAAGNCHVELQNWQAAERSFQRAIRLTSSVYPSLNLADVYVSQKRLELADLVVSAAIKRNPAAGNGYHGLALIRYEQRRFDDVIELGAKAHVRSSHCGRAHSQIQGPSGSRRCGGSCGGIGALRERSAGHSGQQANSFGTRANEGSAPFVEMSSQRAFAREWSRVVPPALRAIAAAGHIAPPAGSVLAAVQEQPGASAAITLANTPDLAGRQKIGGRACQRPERRFKKEAVRMPTPGVSIAPLRDGGIRRASWRKPFRMSRWAAVAGRPAAMAEKMRYIASLSRLVRSKTRPA